MKKARHNIILCLFITISLVMSCCTFVLGAQATEAKISAVVHVSGDTPTAKEDFKLVLEAKDDATPMPGGSVGKKKEMTTTAESSVDFGAMNYTQTGVYEYTVVQQAGNTPEYTYDSTSYTVRVYVEDDGSGLKASVTYTNDKTGTKTDDIQFNDIYTKKVSPTQTSTLTVSKAVTGDPIKAESFQFTVEFTGEALGKTFTCVDRNGNKQGTVASGDIVQLRDGDSITITELPVGSGYKVSETPKAHYIPTPLTGVYEGTIKADGNTAAYTNKYDVTQDAPASVDPPVQKQIKGNNFPKNSVFTFQMKAMTKGAPMPDGTSDGIKTIKIKGAGSKEMGYIAFTKAGTYKYKIVEVKGNLKGYTYDNTVYTMTVTVTSDQGILKATRIITKDSGDESEKATFVNHYKRGDSSGPGHVIKKKTSISTFGDLVRTGDASIRFLLGIMSGVIIAIVIILFFRRKGSGEGENHDME